MELRAEKVTEESGQTSCQKWVGPAEARMAITTTPSVFTVTSHLPTLKSTSAGTDACTILIPLNLGLERSTASRGVKITSVEVHYVIAVAACTAITAAIYKSDLPADGTAVSAAEVTSSKDIADASCYDVDEHKVTITPTTPAFIADDEAWWVEIVLTPANTTQVDLIGALVKFTRAL